MLINGLEWIHRDYWVVALKQAQSDTLLQLSVSLCSING